MDKKYTFHVHGMHCASCVLLTESEISEVAGVTRAKADLKTNTMEVEGDFGDLAPEQIAEFLSKPIKPHGYTLSLEKQIKSKNWHDFKIAIPIAIAFAIVFVILQKLGIINWVDASNMSFGTVFLIGVIASLSTCMAVVGGLVLSMSATFAKEGDKVKPQLMFHVGRIVSFFILGGVIGAAGSVFTLSSSASFGLSLFIGIVMLILGINLLEVFPWTKRLQPRIPKFIGAHAHKVSKWGHAVTPLIVGVATFFLPCGFTQSMQLYTLSTGSFLSGGLTMLTFALGTLPVLALVSFSSFSIQKSSWSGVFFKTAGIVVILFAILNLIGSLSAIGLIPPLINL